MKLAVHSLVASFLGFYPMIASAQTPKIDNPLAADDVSGFLYELVQVITTLSIPVIVAFIIYAGFLFVTAGGNQNKLEDAQRTITYTLVGAAIILGARALAEILINTAGSLGVENLD